MDLALEVWTALANPSLKTCQGPACNGPGNLVKFLKRYYYNLMF